MMQGAFGEHCTRSGGCQMNLLQYLAGRENKLNSQQIDGAIARQVYRHAVAKHHRFRQ